MTSIDASTAPTGPEIETFLQQFFSTPNRLTLTKVEQAQGPAAESVRAWVTDLRQARGIVMLPCLRENRREWYGLAFSQKQHRALLELIGAFVGPSYSNFRGSAGGMDPIDPIDRAVLELTQGHALKFAVPSGDALVTAARTALDHMRVLLRNRPVLGAEPPSATGRILRDYFMALRAGDRRAVDRHLKRLETGFRLDPVNLLYLRVQTHAEFGEWKELLALPEVGDLLALRRPIAVTEALLTAVYRTQIARFEESGKVQEAVKQFRTEIYPRYGALFTSRAGLQGRDAQKLYLLFAIAGPAPSAELRDQLVAGIGAEDAGSEFVQQLGALLPPTEVPVEVGELPLVRAERSAHHGQYDEAFGIAISLPASVDRTRVLLDCAYGLGSLQVVKAALDALSDLKDADRVSVLADRRRKQAHDWLLAQTVGTSPTESTIPVPGDWFQWLETVEARPDWSQAVHFSRRGATEWEFEAFLDDERGCAEFGRRLSAACSSEAVRMALPHLLEFFQNDPAWPRRELAPVYRSMVELLVFTSGIGDEDLTVFHQLVEALLSLGGGASLYAELLGYAHDLLRDYSAATRLDWALDMLDLFLAAECPIPELRVSFAASIAATLQRYSKRVTAMQRTVFAELCEELGHRELVPDRLTASDSMVVEETADHDPLSRLGKRSIAVYTLTESAGRRFAELLKVRNPAIVVETNNDHVATDKLKHLARNADIFVMATASAKHAATIFVQSQRPPDRPLLRPAGKGAASMLRAIHEYAMTMET